MVRSQSQTSLAFSFGLAAGLLVLFGLLALSSAGAVVGFQKYHDTYYYFKHQLFFGVIPGALAAFLFSRIPYLTWKRWAQPLFVATLVLLVMVLVPGLGGRVISGAKSWFVVSGISFQPTELLKLTLIFFLARWIEQRGAHRLHTWRDGALPFAMIIGIITILIALQPDVGSLILIIAFSSTLFFVGGANLKHLAVFGGIGALLLVLAIAVAPYRLNRLQVFINPQYDPQGAGYHMHQAMIAIGSGGIFGRGFGHSRQKFSYLPEVVNDSLFAVIAEELGFVLTAVVVGLWILLLLKGMRIARSCPNSFGRFAVGGITLWFFFQFFLNVGAMLGIVPLTGLPLPLMSYGGSAMMTELAAVGFVFNVATTLPKGALK